MPSETKMLLLWASNAALLGAHAALHGGPCILVEPTLPLSTSHSGHELTEALSTLPSCSRSQHAASTLQEALQMARALRASSAGSNVGNQPHIVLLPGRHVLKDTLRLSENDSNLTLRAALPGSAIVSGDRQISGWSACPPGILTNASSPALCAPVSFANASVLAQARHLYAGDGRRLRRAESASSVVAAFQNPVSVDLDKYVISSAADPAFAQWLSLGPDNIGNIEMVYTAQGSPWTESRCTVENVSLANPSGDLAVYMKQPCFASLQQKPCGQGTHTPTLVENTMPDDLGPGAWYLHRPVAQGVGQQCAADFGSSEPCCGQGGGSVPAAYQCPATAPACTNYVFDSHYGICESPKTARPGAVALSDAPCKSDDDCRLPCPAGEEGQCVAASATCACVSEASRATFAVYYPMDGEIIDASTTMHMPVLEELTATTGAMNVGFEGLVFEYATWSDPSKGSGYVEQQSGALVNYPQPSSCTDYLWDPMPSNVVFHHTTGVVISNCTFRHLGAGAVQFDNGAHANTVTGSQFYDVSGAAIQLGRYDTFNITDVSQQEVQNTFEDNSIQNVATEYHGNAGISIGYSRDTRVVHNSIQNVTYSGISIGWGWSREQDTYAQNNTVAGNLIRGFKLQEAIASLGDGGGIYALGPQQNSSMVGNWVSEMGSGRGGGAFYPDEGSAYWTISDNVFSNASFCADDCQWLHIWTSSIHDIVTTNCFTDTATQDVKGTNTPVTNITVVPKGTPRESWPSAAQEIMSAAGPRV